MTFKALMNFRNLANPTISTPIDRYHSGSGGSYHHGHHQGSYKSSKGGGSGAALSALTLLAFLFLINVMQQSLQESNPTTTPTTTTVLLRDDELPIVVDAKEAKGTKKGDDFVQVETSYPSRSKSLSKSHA